MDNSEMDELRGVPEQMNSESAGSQGPSTMSTGAATTAAADIVKLPEDIGMAATTAPLHSGPTVVVKVASQSVPDIVVEYQEGWTIKDLKQHLCEQHILHPSVKEQRLIYSGHLLSDESHLASALRHSTASDSRPVLHLVCAPPRPGRAPPQRTQQSPATEAAQHQNAAARAGVAIGGQQGVVAPVGSDAAASSSINSSPGTSSSADANLNPATDGVRHRPHTAGVEGGPSVTVPGAVNPATALHQYYAQYYSYLNYMQLTGATGAYGAANPSALATWVEQQQALAMQHFVTSAQGAAAGLGSQDTALPGPAAPAGDGPPPPLQQRNEVAEAPQLNGPLDNIGGAVAEDEVAGVGHDWLDSLYIITRFGVLSFFIYFYSTVYRFALIITVTVLIYLYHAGWFRPARTPQEQPAQAEPPRQQQQQQQPPIQEQNQPEQQQHPAPQPQDADDNNQLREPPVFFAPNNMDDRNNNIANNNNNNDVDEMLIRDQPYHEQVPAVVAEPAVVTAEASAPPPPSLFMLSWTFLTTFFTSLIPEQPNLL